MLGHENVGRDEESLLVASLFEDVLDDIFCGVGCEEGFAVVTTEVDEVEVPGMLVTFGPVGMAY